METPCRNECHYNARLGMCESCGRTTEDLTNWITMSKDERLNAMRIAKQRLNKEVMQNDYS
jgi:predicted Fe-S protein YdhL (DUF1289 family)